MPIEGQVRYRFKDIGNGKKQRLAFRGNRVIEAVTYSADGKKTGAVHTPAEFKADAAKKKRQPLRLRGTT
jgi:hypothetical protein